MSADPGLAGFIDHTLLKADARTQDIVKLCGEAREYGFWSVCVNPSWVAACARELKGFPVKISAVVGFPLGATLSSAKAFEAGEAVAAGASEIDMVMNVGAMRSKDFDFAARDIRAVVAAGSGGY